MDVIDHLLSTANVAETADIAKNVGIAVDNATLTDEYLNGENVNLKANASIMVKGLGTDHSKELMEELNNADGHRDELLNALLYFLQGYVRWNKETTRPAAERLLKVIKAHGNGIARLSKEKESATLESILEEFEKEEMVQAITTLGQTELIADLQTAQEEYQALYRQSAKLESAKPEVIAPTKLKKETVGMLNTLIDYLNVMNNVNTATYGALTATVAELINSLNSKIRVRHTAITSSEENMETS